MKLLRIAGTLLLFALLAWKIEWAKVATAFAGMSAGLWLAACAVFILSQFASAWRWTVLSRPLGFHAPFHRMAGMYWVGMFFNLILPGGIGGDAVRAWHLTRLRPAWGNALLSVFADRASGLAVLVVLAGVAALLVPLPAWMARAVACLVAGLVLGSACLPLLRFMGKQPLVGKVRAMLRAYATEPSAQVVALLASVVVQLSSVVQVWLVAIALGLDVPFLHLMAAVPLVSLLSVLPISVGGHGVREAGMALMLAPVGVPAAEAVTLSLAYAASSMLVASAGGIIHLMGPWPQDMKRPTDADSLGRDPGEGRARQPAKAA